MQRAADMQAVETFLDAARGATHALLVDGDPGIGKTTLAATAASAAARLGFVVARLHAGRPETSVSFAALGDLLEAVPGDVLDELPRPLRDALGVMTLGAPAAEVRQDARAVSLATLAVVRRMAADRPLLLLVDDVQWLDVSSARVLSFVLQRLDHEPVGLLVTRRTAAAGKAPLDVEHDAPAGRVRRLLLGPMSQPAFCRLLRDRVASDLPRSIVLQVHAAVEGNPFYGQEVARELVRRGLPDPGSPMPLPDDAYVVVRQRLAALQPPTRAVLLAAAICSRPSVALLSRALADIDVETALAEAEDENLVVIRCGRTRFRHAIFASAVTAGASAPDRRAAHRRLATACDSPEERARHLALSSLEPESAVAEALEAAQVNARRRGATAAAAELADLAQAFTPEDEPTAALRRSLASGMLAFEAGDAVRGLETLRHLVDELPPGPDRAAVMVALCEICWQDTVEVEQLATAAIQEPGADGPTLVGAHVMLAWVCVYRGRLARAREHVDLAAALVDQVEDDDPSVRSDLMTIAALTAFLSGRPYQPLIAEAVRLEDLVSTTRPVEETTIYSGARVTRGLIGLLGGRLEQARCHLEAELDRLAARGRYVARDEILCYLAHVACRTGRWDEGERLAEECLEIGHEAGHRLGRGQNVLPRAWLAAVRGEHAEARAMAEEALELSTGYRDELAAAVARGVLGLVALSSGELPSAADHLRRVVLFVASSGGCWPWLLPSVADAAEVLVGLGRLDEAQAVLADTAMTGRCAPDARQPALTARAAAAVAAARGEVGEAAALLDAALGDQALRQQPFEHARARLVAGVVERRRRSPSRARTHLECAAAAFTELGAPLWSERARVELARLGGGRDVAGLTSSLRHHPCVEALR